MKKRERQARRLLKVCVREFRASCLEEYVDAFEAGSLKHMSSSHCALGAMSRGDERCGVAADMRSAHGRAARHVENIFEGWGMFKGLPLWMRVRTDDRCRWDELEESTRRRLIYEACVEELARRGAAKVEPEPEKVPA